MSAQIANRNLPEIAYTAWIMRIISILVLSIGFSQAPALAALTCASIREKADATYQNKKTKPLCTLIEHTLGISPGSTESVFECGKQKFRLNQEANDTCKVTLEK